MKGKLKKKIIYTGHVLLKAGLHIGGTNTALNIGGPDKFVVRNPLTNIPYIPGSSLKGKMRALVEIYNGEIDNEGPSTDSTSGSGALFGTAADKKGHPSRLIVRDAPMATENDSEAELEKYGIKVIPDYSNTELPYTETKTETWINRITAESKPRTFERVPAGAQFKLEMILNIFDDEDEAALKATLDKAMRLLADDYLGGSGSRGYGKIEFKEIHSKEKTY